ncbi:unnamed protein product, partial [marine sediment metagenome]
MMHRYVTVAILTAFVALAMSACAAGSVGTPESAESAGEPLSATSVSTDEGPIVVRARDTFTVDSFLEAGFKKSKEFSTETVPEATSIWYGFYSRRDV